MAKKLYPEESVQAIADAIRGKNSSSDTYKIGDMASAISEIPTGDHDVEDGIIQKTLSGVYENSRVTTIGHYAFTSCSTLTAVDFPSVQTVFQSAFQNCSMLETINMPVVHGIRSSAFCSCSSLESAVLPSCANMQNAVFDGCSALSYFSAPLTELGQNAFIRCINLSEVYLNPSTKCNINQGAFSNCSKLSKIVILGSQVGSLYNSNAFSNTPIALSSFLGYFGSIYVPASLVDSFKEAVRWSYYSDRITSYVEE